MVDARLTGEAGGGTGDNAACSWTLAQPLMTSAERDVVVTVKQAPKEASLAATA